MYPQTNMRAAGGDQDSKQVRHSVDEKQSVASRHDEIPFLQATLFACVLEDCIKQLRTLDACNNELRIIKTKTDMGHLLALKFHVKQTEDKDELDNINHNDLESNQHKLNKLFSDRKYFKDVLKQAYLDMALNRCFSSLTASIKTVADRDEYRANLTEQEGINKTTRRELMKQLRQQRNHIKSIGYDTDLTVDSLKCQVEDTGLNSEIRSRFVDNWQRARTEQHIQSIFDKESGPSNAIRYLQNRSDHEQRAHSEIELLVNIFINETLTKVDNWMNKFDIDMESQDLKIAKMKNKYEDIIQKKLDLENMYATHEVSVKKWVQFKEERQAAINYRENMMNSALIVQAWWRGLLVRLNMGPYKPMRRGKPSAEKKNKK